MLEYLAHDKQWWYDPGALHYPLYQSYNSCYPVLSSEGSLTWNKKPVSRVRVVKLLTLYGEEGTYLTAQGELYSFNQRRLTSQRLVAEVNNFIYHHGAVIYYSRGNMLYRLDGTYLQLPARIREMISSDSQPLAVRCWNGRWYDVQRKKGKLQFRRCYEPVRSFFC
jgi:hypothetical protein